MLKTASIIKLPILVHVALAVQEGHLSWDDTLTLTAEEKVAGSGVLTQLQPGLALTLRDVCTLMTVVSDNTATNMVIEHIGVEPVNMRMRSLGLKQTTLTRKAYSTDAPTPLSQKFGLGVTTPREILRLLTLLAEGKIGGEVLSADLLDILSKQQYRDGIPRLLPEDWKYAGKTGAVNPVRNDVGLVTTAEGKRYALSLFCQELPLVQWTSDNPGLLALAHLTKHLLSHWGAFP